MAYNTISKHIKISFYNFLATNDFYWSAIVQTVLFERQSLSMV